jgi:hypothetical protein
MIGRFRSSLQPREFKTGSQLSVTPPLPTPEPENFLPLTSNAQFVNETIEGVDSCGRRFKKKKLGRAQQFSQNRFCSTYSPGMNRDLSNLAVDETRVARPSFADAFRFWLKLGFISFWRADRQIAITSRSTIRSDNDESQLAANHDAEQRQRERLFPARTARCARRPPY